MTTPDYTNKRRIMKKPIIEIKTDKNGVFDGKYRITIEYVDTPTQ